MAVVALVIALPAGKPLKGSWYDIHTNFRSAAATD
jgi:hypothetical protein